MDNNANLAYLTAIINSYERQINKATTATIKSTVLKEVVGTLGDLLDFMSDRKATESKTTLDVNAELIESARAYKSELAEKERVITRLDTKNKELHVLWYSMDRGKLETENRMLEAENLKLRSDNQMWQMEVNNLKLKLEKATKCQWWID